MELILAVAQVIWIILMFGWFIPTLLSVKTAEEAFKTLNKLVALIFMLMGITLIIITVWEIS